MSTPAKAGWAPERVVVGVDGSDASIAALRWVGELCRGRDSAIDATICWEYPTTNGMGGMSLDWDPAADADQVMTSAVKSAFGADIPPGLTTSVRHGHPAHVLVEESRGADLLVVGTRGHGGFVGLLLGSVSTYCIEHAACPVTVTRSPAD